MTALDQLKSWLCTGLPDIQDFDDEIRKLTEAEEEDFGRFSERHEERYGSEYGPLDGYGVNIEKTSPDIFQVSPVRIPRLNKDGAAVNSFLPKPVLTYSKSEFKDGFYIFQLASNVWLEGNRDGRLLQDELDSAIIKHLTKGIGSFSVDRKAGGVFVTRTVAEVTISSREPVRIQVRKDGPKYLKLTFTKKNPP